MRTFLKHIKNPYLCMVLVALAVQTLALVFFYSLPDPLGLSLTEMFEGKIIWQVFMAFGAKRTVYELNAEGVVEKKKYLDYSAVTDERIVDGLYYASAFKKIRSCMQHPEQLDLPPEVVKEDIY